MECGICNNWIDDEFGHNAEPIFKGTCCNECNMICTGNHEDNIYECKKCNNYGDFTKIYIPYACKLFLQELMAMSIGPRFITD